MQVKLQWQELFLTTSTGILKYWNDKDTHGVGYGGTVTYYPQYGLDRYSFTESPAGGGSIDIRGNGGDIILQIDTAFTGSTMQINNETYNLGQSFCKWSCKSRSSKIFWQYNLR